MSIEVNCVQKASSCRQYTAGKCPIVRIGFALDVSGLSFEGATDVLKTEQQLLPRNEIYGVGLRQNQLEEAENAVVTADCAYGRKCSVLIRNTKATEDNVGAKVVTAGWRVDRLIKTGKGKQPQRFQI